jgi:hypothetical protein
MQARIKESLDLSQRLGEEGDVDGSMMAAQQADAMKQQHEALQRSLTQPERTMTVCEICGVFINSTDNDQRKAVSAARGDVSRAPPGGGEACVLRMLLRCLMHRLLCCRPMHASCTATCSESRCCCCA